MASAIKKTRLLYLEIWLRNEMSTEWNKCWGGHQYHRSWWGDENRKELEDAFHKVYDFDSEDYKKTVYDTLHSLVPDMVKAIVEHDRQGLYNIAKVMQEQAVTIKAFADACYTYEDGWNPRLPKDFTKVIGHEYTCTEWIRQRTEFLADTVASIASEFITASQQTDVWFDKKALYRITKQHSDNNK